ncbi:Tex family protein [Paraferrimonas sp. SM1919]|uniref:Tex family protein n=1 Tax=Paraferrimonas sp. SM1919 TaxID=2662263 RepID=UPI0013D6C507|nr:Tex family protein [Paraferrimonas sp. SM1919]
MQSIPHIIASELQVQPSQVQATIALLDEGATVPFIARYRKEKTGGLDDTQLRNLAERLTYLTELNDRRQVILASIEQQDKLTPELKAAIEAADTKNRLEDLYLPYKPKRRTKGEIAKEAGLEPLADMLIADPTLDPEHEAQAFLNNDQDINDTKAALDGARYILMERFAEDANLLQKVRDYLSREATVEAKVIAGQEAAGEKFRDYFEHSEPLSQVPSHRALAMLRGRNEGILSIALNADPSAQDNMQHAAGEQLIREHLGIVASGRAADKWLTTVISWTWRIKVALHLENELISKLRENAETEAIKVFARNLGDLLMAAPAGRKATMGLDPGLRTGVKVACVDNTGKLVAHTTIYPHAPQNQWEKSKRALATLAKMHKIELIAVGNGTASRETDKLAGELLSDIPELKAQKIMVSEAGASVYSASELAAKEFPDLDVSIRGAVSIARRLQDPLAELVKIEPKAIGVGQYQHDVSQSQLAQSLDNVVEDCVNGVGVEINMASAPLLARVAGLSKTLANNIVAYRDLNGAFKNRKELLSVPRLGPKAYEQAAGFLRIQGGDNALDSSGVHPETYELVQAMAQSVQLDVASLIGNRDNLRKIDAKAFVSEDFGLPTINDILKELEKPGRDPRGEFKTAEFKEGVNTIADLYPEMILEGVVTNVANFGAFVDIGVHQDGLVHISALSDKFIDDPSKVVKAGDVVKVKVMEVDAPRKRISLTMRLTDKAPSPMDKQASPRDRKPIRTQAKAPSQPSQNGAMGNAFADALAKLKK